MHFQHVYNSAVHVATDADYDVPFPSAEEGDPGISAGRPTGIEYLPL